MPPRTPVIPEYITVHLGKPGSDAPNVQVPFVDYIKNVASSEIYPTWPESAIRANIYAQISFALNRIYTEWYRAKGYDFDITNSTQYDQAFNYGREVFDNISEIVDDIFNDYVVREGFVEPFFTQFCDGINVQCEGLSQWGSVDLAEQGYTPYDILKHYYGDNIGIVFNAPVQNVEESFQGVPLRFGSAGNDVKIIQGQLNRIAKNFPAIPKIPRVDGVFGTDTEKAVRKFQEVFNMPVDGVIGKRTWYRIKNIYTNVKQLGELTSEGITLGEIAVPFPEVLKSGMTGDAVKILQYYLDIIGYFWGGIPLVKIDGIFGPKTEEAVRAFQQAYGLPVDGIVGVNTWARIDSIYKQLIKSLPAEQQAAVYPGYPLKVGMQNNDVLRLQQYLNRISKDYPAIPSVNETGYFGDMTENAVAIFQRENGLTQTGIVNAFTWDKIATLYNQLQGA